MTTSPHGTDPGQHDTHDRVLIAACAAGDLSGPELDHARVLIASCLRCEELVRELRSIAAATSTLPPVSRPPALDFRLTTDRAVSLARGRTWRRFLRPFGRRGNTPVRPLAAAFTTLGLAGLLLAALPVLPFGGTAMSQGPAGGASAPRDLILPSHETTVVAPALPTPDPLGLKAQEPVTENVAAGAGEAAATDEARTDDGPAGSSGPGSLVLLSLGFIGAGLGLLLLRRAAIRLR